MSEVSRGWYIAESFGAFSFSPYANPKNHAVREGETLTACGREVDGPMREHDGTMLPFETDGLWSCKRCAKKVARAAIAKAEGGDA